MRKYKKTGCLKIVFFAYVVQIKLQMNNQWNACGVISKLLP